MTPQHLRPATFRSFFVRRSFFLLRVWFVIRRYRFTEGGDAFGSGSGALGAVPGEILGMDDRAGRREIGACSVILFPVLFDIDGYLKRYAGGLVVIRPRSLHIGPLAQAMIWVSASLFVGSREWNDERMITCPRGK